MVKIYFLLMLHVHCRLAAGPLCVVFILGWGWWRKLYGTRSLWSQREKQRSWGSTYRLLKLPPGSYTSHFCSHFIVQSMQMAQSDIHEAWCVILPRWGGAGVGKVTGQQYSDHHTASSCLFSSLWAPWSFLLSWIQFCVPETTHMSMLLDLLKVF